jgi:hypothetical protein
VMGSGVNCSLRYPYDRRGPKLDHGGYAVDVCSKSMSLPLELPPAGWSLRFRQCFGSC